MAHSIIYKTNISQQTNSHTSVHGTFNYIQTNISQQTYSQGTHKHSWHIQYIQTNISQQLLRSPQQNFHPKHFFKLIHLGKKRFKTKDI